MAEPESEPRCLPQDPMLFNTIPSCVLNLCHSILKSILMGGPTLLGLGKFLMCIISYHNRHCSPQRLPKVKGKRRDDYHKTHTIINKNPDSRSVNRTQYTPQARRNISRLCLNQITGEQIALPGDTNTGPSHPQALCGMLE